MDRYSRTIVGWSLEDTMTTGLVENAFRSCGSSPKACLWIAASLGPGRAGHERPMPRHAGAAGRPREHEPDGRRLRRRGGGVMLGKLKTGMVYHERFRTKAQARVVFESMERFCDRKRLHAAQGYRSPEAFEARWVG